MSSSQSAFCFLSNHPFSVPPPSHYPPPSLTPYRTDRSQPWVPADQCWSDVMCCWLGVRACMYSDFTCKVHPCVSAFLLPALFPFFLSHLLILPFFLCSVAPAQWGDCTLLFTPSAPSLTCFLSICSSLVYFWLFNPLLPIFFGGSFFLWSLTCWSGGGGGSRRSCLIFGCSSWFLPPPSPPSCPSLNFDFASSRSSFSPPFSGSMSQITRRRLRCVLVIPLCILLLKGLLSFRWSCSLPASCLVNTALVCMLEDAVLCYDFNANSSWTIEHKLCW